MQEIALQLGCQVAAEDAVVNLHAAGLAHRIHEFVFPTRAAVRCHEIADAA